LTMRADCMIGSLRQIVKICGSDITLSASDSAARDPPPAIWTNRPALAGEFDYAYYASAADAQLQQTDRIFELVAREFDCDIVILCETNTRRLSHVDAERQVIRRRAHAGLVRLCYERAAG